MLYIHNADYSLMFYLFREKKNNQIVSCLNFTKGLKANFKYFFTNQRKSKLPVRTIKIKLNN